MAVHMLAKRDTRRRIPQGHRRWRAASPVKQLGAVSEETAGTTALSELSSRDDGSVRALRTAPEVRLPALALARP
jgi:hypothetical protein